MTVIGDCRGYQTMGSVVGPAQINNVVGFKTTRNLIGTDGIPISKRQVSLVLLRDRSKTPYIC